jgi:hypothetical protein
MINNLIERLYLILVTYLLTIDKLININLHYYPRL